MTLDLDDEAMTQIMMKCIALTGYTNTYVLFWGHKRDSGHRHLFQGPQRVYSTIYGVSPLTMFYIIPEDIINTRGAHLYISKNTRRTPPASINPVFKNHAWPDLTNGTDGST